MGPILGPRGPKGVRAGAGTPTDPKSPQFGTKWVAIPPFLTSGPASCTEFRRGSRRDSPAPSISTFFSTIFDPKSGFLKKHRFLKMGCPENPRPSRAWGPRGPRGPSGALKSHILGPQGAQGAQGGPRGPRAPICPVCPVCWVGRINSVYCLIRLGLSDNGPGPGT